MKYTFLCAVLLSSCGFSDPRTPSLSEDSKLHILLRAQQTANWAPWCEDYPSKANCNDGDAMAEAVGFLCAVGFAPSCDAVRRSVRDNGQLLRAPGRTDTDNTASRDQLFGFMASQLSGETRWLDVKRFIKDNGRICNDATDGRCELTPVSLALLGFTHAHLGYTRDATMWINGQLFGKTLLTQSISVPTGYQLNLVAEASYLAWKTGFEDRVSYESARNVYLRQPFNPWFCYVVKGADEECARLALSLWPEEPEVKDQWSIARDTQDDAWSKSMGWEWLFMAALFGVDLNSLSYAGEVYRKTSP
jgi:hypothetical protein